MSYGISSRAYLQRALDLLSKEAEAEMFHAAFELRCGVEARMEEYLEAWNEITKKKKRGWQIQVLARDIEKTFRTGDKVVRLAVHRDPQDECFACFYYTPVKKSLRKIAECLGNYMHSKKCVHPREHTWWLRFRSELERAANELAAANMGTLLGPPLHNPLTGEVSLKVEMPEGASGVNLGAAMEKGVQRVVKVEYLSALPMELEAAAHYWRPRASKVLQPPSSCSETHG